MALNLAPSTHVESGFDDFSAKITKAHFVDDFTYGGQQNPRVALAVIFETPSMEKPYEQFYSIGEPSEWGVTNEGKSIEPKGNKTGISSQSNASFFITSLVDAGFAESKFESGDISVIEGLFVHLVRQLNPKVKAKKGEEGKQKPTLIVAKILDNLDGVAAKKPSAPATSNAASTNTASKPATTTAPAATSTETVDSMAAEVLMGILMNNESKINRSKIPTLAPAAVKAAYPDGKSNQAIVTKIFNKDFLATENGWKFNAATGDITLE